jgi:hypothetical protein
MQSPGRSAGASSTRARGWVGHRSSEFFDFYSSKNSLKLNREFSHKKYKNKLIFLPGESSHLIIIIILCDIVFLAEGRPYYLGERWGIWVSTRFSVIIIFFKHDWKLHYLSNLWRNWKLWQGWIIWRCRWSRGLRPFYTTLRPLPSPYLSILTNLLVVGI